MKYKVSLSDRKKERTVEAENQQHAIQIVTGKRLLTCRMDTWAPNGRYTIYTLAVATGKTIGGSTPFKNISARVEPGCL